MLEEILRPFSRASTLHNPLYRLSSHPNLTPTTPSPPYPTAIIFYPTLPTYLSPYPTLINSHLGPYHTTPSTPSLPSHASSGWRWIGVGDNGVGWRGSRLDESGGRRRVR